MGFFQRHAILLGVGAIALAGIIVAVFQSCSGDKPAPRRAAPELSMIRVDVPPPPPPPPVPRPEPEPENSPTDPQEMIAQEPIAPDEEKPSATPEAPADEQPAGETMGTSIQGNGPPDGFGLVGSGGGGIVGLGGAGTGGGGQRAVSRWGWYGSQVQKQIHDALLENKTTRSAPDVRIVVRLWPDAAGRITHAELARTTGDPALDEAIRKEVLTGLTLREPPPSDMPLPIVLRITGKRP